MMKWRASRVAVLAAAAVAAVPVLFLAAVGVRSLWHRDHRTSARRILLDEGVPAGDVRVIAAEGDMALCLMRTKLADIIEDVEWFLMWRGKPLVSLRAPRAEARPEKVTIYEADRTRISVSLDPTSGIAHGVEYWSYEGEGFEVRTDLDADGQVDAMARSNEGVFVLLGGQWVLARGSGATRDVELAGESVAVQFKDGQWQLVR